MGIELSVIGVLCSLVALLLRKLHNERSMNRELRKRLDEEKVDKWRAWVEAVSGIHETSACGRVMETPPGVLGPSAFN